MKETFLINNKSLKVLFLTYVATFTWNILMQPAEAEYYVNVPPCGIACETVYKAPLYTVNKPNCDDSITISHMDIQCEHILTIINNFGRDETLIAIIMQESEFNPLAMNVNKNGSIDRGIYQLNSTYWKFKDGDFNFNTTQAVQCKKDLGYHCWWAYRNGDYKKKLPLAKELLSKI